MPRSSIEDPLKINQFLVEVDGFQRAGFSEVSGLERKTEVISYREGGDNNQPRKSAGTTDYTNIMLKRGVLAAGQGGTTDFIDWIKTVHDVQANLAQARDYRRDFDIRVLNRDGSTGARYRIYQAWPCNWKTDDLKGDGNDTLCETLEIVHEGIERIL